MVLSNVKWNGKRVSEESMQVYESLSERRIFRASSDSRKSKKIKSGYSNFFGGAVKKNHPVVRDILKKSVIVQ